MSSTTGSAGRDRADRCKTQTPTAAGGLFSKDRFDINLGAQTGDLPGRDHRARSARPAPAAAPPTSGRPAPPARCARSAPPPPAGARVASARTSRPSPTPAPARPTRPGSPTTAPPDPRSNASSATSMRRHHGGRRARVRGTARVDADFRLLAAAVNLARLAMLGLRGTAPRDGRWRPDQREKARTRAQPRPPRPRRRHPNQRPRPASGANPTQPEGPSEASTEQARPPNQLLHTSHLGRVRESSAAEADALCRRRPPAGLPTGGVVGEGRYNTGSGLLLRLAGPTPGSPWASTKIHGTGPNRSDVAAESVAGVGLAGPVAGGGTSAAAARRSRASRPRG